MLDKCMVKMKKPQVRVAHSLNTALVSNPGIVIFGCAVAQWLVHLHADQRVFGSTSHAKKGEEIFLTNRHWG